MSEITWDTTTLNAYTAGLIDGEGSVMLLRINGATSNRSPVVSVTSTTRELVDFLKDNYGGTIVNQKVYKEHYKKAWIWKVSNSCALAFLQDIVGMLQEPKKRHRAQFLLDYYHKVTRINGRYSPDELTAKLKFEADFLLIE